MIQITEAEYEELKTKAQQRDSTMWRLEHRRVTPRRGETGNGDRFEAGERFMVRIAIDWLGLVDE